MAPYVDVQTPSGVSRKFSLPEDRRVVIGRASDADLRVEDDGFLSRRHAEVWMESGLLMVRRLPHAPNPIVCRGETGDEFALDRDELFAIGKTQFTFRDSPPLEPIAREDAPSVMRTMPAEDIYAIKSVQEHSLLQRLLELPEILSSKAPYEVFKSIVGTLKVSTGASYACIATETGDILARSQQDEEGAAEHISPPLLSRTLIKHALDESPRPTLYCWSSQPQGLSATMEEGTDWAICAAVKITGQSPYVLYVAGAHSSGLDGETRRQSTRIVGLVADIVSRSMSLQRLEVRQARLRHFFSGPVAAKILESPDGFELEPRPADSAVMFFDLRKFTLRTEESSEKIMGYVHDLRKVMTVMTDEIFRENGVVLLYLGDGIMACWNVPIADRDFIDHACRAALAMTGALQRIPGDWRGGIGIDAGEVVAGSIGSEQVFSYSVVGNTVNRASRIEGMSKLVGVPVLVSRRVAEGVSREVGLAVPLGRFQPVGMQSIMELFALYPPEERSGWVEAYLSARSAFDCGRFREAIAILQGINAPDRPAAYLRSVAESLADRPPANWDGVIRMTGK